MKNIISRLESANLTNDDIKVIAEEVNNTFSDQEVVDLYGYVNFKNPLFLPNVLKLHRHIKERVANALIKGVTITKQVG